MKLADGIRKHGFRKWYERELLQGHAHLALLLLCVIGLLMALEASSKFLSWVDQLTDLVAVLLCAGAGLWALRRYLYLLTHAEAVANQADCPQCGTYGRMTLLACEDSVEDGEASQRVHVGCRQCRHEWRIDA